MALLGWDVVIITLAAQNRSNPKLSTVIQSGQGETVCEHNKCSKV